MTLLYLVADERRLWLTLNLMVNELKVTPWSLDVAGSSFGIFPSSAAKMSPNVQRAVSENKYHAIICFAINRKFCACRTGWNLMSLELPVVLWVLPEIAHPTLTRTTTTTYHSFFHLLGHSILRDPSPSFSSISRSSDRNGRYETIIIVCHCDSY